MLTYIGCPLTLPPNCYGLAVSDTLIAVTLFDAGSVRLFSAATFAVIRTFGSTGPSELQFDMPFRVCFSSPTLLIVADSGNRRLQV